MATTQTQRVRRLSGANQIVDVLDGGETTVASADISDATDVGKALLTADDAEAARTAIGAAATTETAIADLTADPTMADFNALLAVLRTAGIFAS